MVEGDRAVVRVALAHQHMAVEAAHFGDGEHADAAEAAGGHVEHLALGHIGAQDALAVALEAVEGDVAGGDVALKGAAGEVRLAALRLQQAVLDELVLDGAAGAELAFGGVAAVEAHEGVAELVVVLALDVLVVDVGGHGVVDVEQGHGVVRYAQADVLAQRAVDVHLAGHGDAAPGQAGVDVAGLKAELAGEGGPALVGEGHVLPRALVVFGPVQKRQLELRHAAVEVLVIGALAHLGGHVAAHLVDAGVVLVLLEGHQQVQLAVFLDLHAQLVEAFDGGVAGEEVLRAGAEGDDLEVLHADDGAGDGQEVADALGGFLRRAHGGFGDVGAEMPHAQVVGAVEQAAVGVAAAVDHVAVALGRGHVHARALKALGDQRFGGFGAEVAQEHHQRVAAGGAHVLDGLEGVLFVLHGDGALVEALAIGLDDGGAASLAQRDGEAVAADGDDAGFDDRNVVQHDVHSPLHST